MGLENLFQFDRLVVACCVDLLGKLLEIPFDETDSSPWPAGSNSQLLSRGKAVSRHELIHIFCAASPFLTEERFSLLVAHGGAG